MTTRSVLAICACLALLALSCCGSEPEGPASTRDTGNDVSGDAHLATDEGVQHDATAEVGADVPATDIGEDSEGPDAQLLDAPAADIGPDVDPCAEPEVCDGVDNDCDGAVDEDLVRDCVDPCRQAGSQQCSGGTWQFCVAAAPPPETCDGTDNDCDGLVDEDLTCPAEKPRLWVFVLAGQSNMVGLGINSELTGADANPVAQAHIYYNDSVHPNTNTLRWMGLRPGFGVFEDRFGPELSFGRRVRELWPQRTIAIIKLAEGATALHDRWAAGTGDLYALLLQEIQTQMSDLTIEWRPQLVGFVWMQGESDALGDHADAYEFNLVRFLEALREDANAPLLPITAGLISPHGGWPEVEAVRSATSRVADIVGPMEVVETNDLPPHQDDPAHYNSASNLTLGRRFADSLLGIFDSSWSYPGDFGATQGDDFWTYRVLRHNGGVDSLIYRPNETAWGNADPDLRVSNGEVVPGTTDQAEFAWMAPYAGRVQVSVSVQSVSATGGDGVWASVSDGSRVLWGPQAVPSAAPALMEFPLDVAQGQQLTFRTSSGPDYNVTGDVARWSVDIAMTAVDE